MKPVNIYQAKAQLSELVRLAEAGEEVLIARANKPVVRLVPLEPTQKPRQLGEAKGLVTIEDGFDTLPEDFLKHFG